MGTGCHAQAAPELILSAIMLGEGVDRCLYLLDEWRHDPAHAQARLTDAQLSAGIRSWLDAEHHPTQHGIRPQGVVADPAAASFRVQLHQDGTVTQTADHSLDAGRYAIATTENLWRPSVPIGHH